MCGGLVCPAPPQYVHSMWLGCVQVAKLNYHVTTRITLPFKGHLPWWHLHPQTQSPESEREKEFGEAIQDDLKDLITDKIAKRAFRLEIIRAREKMKDLQQDLRDLRSTVRVCESRLDKKEETVRDIQLAQKSTSGTNPDFIETIRASEKNVLRLHRAFK